MASYSELSPGAGGISIGSTAPFKMSFPKDSPSVAFNTPIWSGDNNESRRGWGWGDVSPNLDSALIAKIRSRSNSVR